MQSYKSYKAEMGIFGLFLLFPRLLNILQIFLHIPIGNVKGFHKMYIRPYFDEKNVNTFFTI